MLGHIHHLQNDLHVWILAGTGNNLRYVNLTKKHSQLWLPICKSLPRFHEITGCDYNFAFYIKGKLKPYKLFKNKKKKQKNTKKLLSLATAEFLKMMLNNKISSALHKIFLWCVSC